MLLKYIATAMHKAHYEFLTNDKKYYGEIPECKGVYAYARTLEECRDELEEVLEEWLLFRVYKKLDVPVIGGVKLEVKEVS